MPGATTQVLRRARRSAMALGRHALLVDALIVAGLVAVSLAGSFDGAPATTAGRLFGVTLALPLLVRRRWPVAVFVVVAAVTLAQWLVDVETLGDLAVLVALYTVAATQPTRVTAAAGLVAEVGAVLAVARWAAGLQDAFGPAGVTLAVALMGATTRSRRALVASLQERAIRLEAERDQQGRLSAAAERSRIAREMHDIVAHNVSVMIALADGAAYAIHDDPDAAAGAMATTSRTGRQALAEMRRLLGVLGPEGTDRASLAPQPGFAELPALVEQVRAAGLPVEVERVGRPAPLPAGLQLAVYRVVQEALTNTLKHAGPGASARLRIEQRPDGLEAEVTDDGRTTPAEVVPSRPVGAGLRGMRERASVYDGAVSAGPLPAGGWRVLLTVPLAPALARS